MKKVVNITLDDVTLAQLEYVRKHWGRDKSNMIASLINNEFYRMVEVGIISEDQVKKMYDDLFI